VIGRNRFREITNAAQIEQDGVGFRVHEAPDLPGGIDRSRDRTQYQSMVKGYDQRATVVAENSPQPNLLSKICQAFSPVKRYNTRKFRLFSALLSTGRGTPRWDVLESCEFFRELGGVCVRRDTTGLPGRNRW
jgi:hypothetical protein